MIKTISLVVVVALAALLLFAATRPDTFQVQRSTRIKAPPEKLFPLINDLHQFNTWNPYNKKDPSMQGTYRGPSSGPGAGFDFQGNKEVGKGSIQIVESAAPARIKMKLDMLEPFEGHNMVEFSLAQRGESTEVTWAMHGPSPYISKLIGIFFNMDRMIGRDFEAGLADLKARAERA
ncbi:MAG TPA: SRPBCC family protein [Burkholderiaceae bacterium]|nr:SRPBCC family protein [Burkholderiaceae bacterium]